jgi:hypothetical protein
MPTPGFRPAGGFIAMTRQIGIIISIFAFVTSSADAAPLCKAPNGQLVLCRPADRKSTMPYGTAGPAYGGAAPVYGGGGGSPPPTYGGGGGGGSPPPVYGSGSGGAAVYGGGPSVYGGGGGPPLASVCSTDYGNCGLTSQQYTGNNCVCFDGVGNAITGVTY